MNFALPRPSLLFPALLAFAHLTALPPAQAAVPAVDWSGEYVSSDLTFAGDVPTNRSGNDAYGDPDGPFPVNGVDSIAGRSLSLDTPFSPPSGYSGTSGTFYGGGSVTRSNSLINDGFSELSVLNQGPNDSLHWHIDSGADEHTFHLLVFWNQPDFLNGLGVMSGLDLSQGAFTVSTAQSSGHHTDELLHWVVRDGQQFYISEATVTLTSQTDYFAPYSTLTSWAPYNPTDPVGAATDADLWSLDFDESGSYNPHNFTDVTALGFYIEHEAATGAVHVHLESFQAGLVPEPSVPLLTVTALLATLLPRRRRALLRRP